ncbi:ABC transporter substrate-binding protein [Actinocatenispora rupis]|uniref:Sugar ABC transporter substrate-binding protein n=1 Tax=Actinocatenispora rupis TaxID=519421 RepID=A0A8J3IYA3_9ACTN|nr:ABC transporter substrate-binding protein [Actinocatenispora rupis]GID10883.1 sugar ABC transporter substrate-binding protein [Actinocatenispora rupis]
MRPRIPRRPLAALLAGACVAAGLAGCTVGGSAASADKQTLTIAEWTNPGAIEFTKELNKQFEKQHPGVTVKLQQAPTANGAWGQLSNSLLQSRSVDVMAQFAPTQAGFAPAYTKIAPAGPAALIAADKLVDLKNQPFMKNYDPTMQAAAVGHNGGVYGVLAAEYVAAGAIWYKKDLLAKYGLQVPTTYQEFIAVCDTLRKKGVTPIFVAGKDGMQGGVWQGIVNQVLMKGKRAGDATTVSHDRAVAFWKGQQSWNDPVYRDATARYQKVMRYIEPSASGVAQQTAPGVWAAKADDYAFLLDGSWDGLTIQQANPKLNLSFFSFPGTDSAADNRVAIKPDLTWVVPTTAPNRKLAMEWLSLFSQKENYQKWLASTGSVSTQPGLSNTGLPWMDWLNAHGSDSFPILTNPWIPAGAAIDAAGPDFSKLAPIGSDSADTILKRSAAAYRKSVG